MTHFSPRAFYLPFLLAAAVVVPALAAPNAPAAPGVPNFHEVNALVYRGGQPNQQGFASLAKLGITTVVDLTHSGADAARERREVEAAGMRYVSVPMNPTGIVEPDAAKVERVLAILNSATGPVFIHCKKGADRTGTVAACYRIEHDHWKANQAQKEANQYGMSWLNIGMKRYIAGFRRTSPSRTVLAAAALPATAH
ncbi:MAG TPA: dual specificity protein phosphatase family protein [Terriglobales bacterium]|nr:dual specificity protein phosphatase family protein [Terriglobales bacterium]